MRPGQNRRMRGRNRKGPNPLTRSFESNGPDVKIRGTAQHIAEKYSQLSRDAQASGDPIAAENYLQHAEHYYRIIAAAQGQFQQTPGFPRPYEDGADESGGEGDEEANGFGYGTPQPAVHEMGAPQPDVRSGPGDDSAYAPRQREPYRDRGERQDRQNDRQNFNDRSDQPRQDGRQDHRQDRRDRFRRDSNPRPAPQPTGEESGPGLPAFLTTPVRQPISVEEANGQEGGFPGHTEGNGEANGGYPVRARRRRGRGRGFGGERSEGDGPDGTEPSDNNAPPTSVE